jgi:hypothetical protein
MEFFLINCDFSTSSVWKGSSECLGLLKQSLVRSGLTLWYTVKEKRSNLFYSENKGAGFKVKVSCWILVLTKQIDNTKKLVLQSSLFWYMAPSASCLFLAWLALQLWRWRRHAPQKRRLIFNRLHKIEHFINTAVRTSDVVSPSWEINTSGVCIANILFRKLPVFGCARPCKVATSHVRTLRVWLAIDLGEMIGYGLDNRGVGVPVPVGSRILYSPCRPDRFWGPSSLLSKGCWGLSPQG